jgi:hypothetical protein
MQVEHIMIHSANPEPNFSLAEAPQYGNFSCQVQVTTFNTSVAYWLPRPAGEDRMLRVGMLLPSRRLGFMRNAFGEQTMPPDDPALDTPDEDNGGDTDIGNSCCCWQT